MRDCHYFSCSRLCLQPQHCHWRLSLATRTNPWSPVQWRYSEFLEAVENNKIERVLFNKDGDVLQALAEGRRALVIVPKDPNLVDTLLKHNVDFQGETHAKMRSCTSIGNCIY